MYVLYVLWDHSNNLIPQQSTAPDPWWRVYYVFILRTKRCGVHEPTIICRRTLHSCRLLSSHNFRKIYRTPFYVELSKPGFRRLKYVQQKQIHARIVGSFLPILTDSDRFCDIPSLVSGWWFGTFFIFHNIWYNPSH